MYLMSHVYFQNSYYSLATTVNRIFRIEICYKYLNDLEIYRYAIVTVDLSFVSQQRRLLANKKIMKEILSD